MWLFAVFIAVPLIEIALFIQVGGIIGLWPTLLIVLLTAFLGTQLLRQQGQMAIRDVQSSMTRLQDPSAPLAHGAMIVFGAALLLTPGFFTDALGLALMVPRVRNWAMSQISARIAARHPQAMRHEADIVDAEFDDVTPRPTHTPGESGWTRH